MTKARRSVRRPRVPGGWAPSLLALIFLSASAGILYVRWIRHPHLPGGDGGERIRGYLDRLVERGVQPPRRLVYPYSVIPGGVASPGEVAEAMARDEVVARHYAGFDARRGRTVTLREPRLAYVSYRIRDEVYFTKKPVRLFAGEQIITDGRTTIRARCGNKVEEAPQMAVSPEEPPEEVLNTPRLEAEPERPPLGAPALTGPAEPQETPLAAVVPPPDFTPLGTPVRGPGAAWLTPAPPMGLAPPSPSPRPGPPGVLPPPPPGTPPPDTVAPPPGSGPPPVTPPPGAPPGTAPPGTPPPGPSGPPSTTPPPGTPPGSTPPGTAPPPGTPPSTPPPGTPPGSTPPGTVLSPGTPPTAPPGTPPATPPGTPPTVPPGNPPATTPPGTAVTPPAVPPGGNVPPVVLPPPPPGTDAPPDILLPPDVTPPPDVPEPPEIPEPSTYALVAIGLLALPLLRQARR